MRLTGSNIYLDANASLPLKTQAKNAMIALMEETGNPSSVHGFGRYVRSQVENARIKMAQSFGVQEAQVIFTSSGSEANNLALNGFKSKEILVSAIEHLSVLNQCPKATRIPVLTNGVIDLNWLEDRLKRSPKPKLVSIMYANNETGILQPLKQAVTLLKNQGILVHCDVVQAFGKYTLNLEEMGVDFLSVSAHKIGGPQGIGALIVSEEAPIRPLIKGGGQERRRRSGTENTLGIVGFGAALEACQKDDWARIQVMRDRIDQETQALTQVPPIGKESMVERLPNTTCLRMPGVESQKQIMAFDLKGIAVSAGSACSSGKVDASHVLKAMGIHNKDTLRVSLGGHNTDKDVDVFMNTWQTIYSQYQGQHI